MAQGRTDTMPTRGPLPLLLLAIMASGSVPAEGADTLAPDYGRFRAKAASIGPRSAPRLADPAVEPASFQALVDAKPIQPSAATTEPQGNPKPTPAAPAPEPPALNISTSKPADPARATPPADPTVVASVAVTKPRPTPANPPRPEGDGRRLLGRPKSNDEPDRVASAGLSENPLESLMTWRPSTQTLTATGGGLAIAVGLLVAMACLFRSCLPKSARPLPRDVVEVLGRAPLGGKQTTQLVRVGSKLVLVAISPDGAETLTEINDPGEVARLVSACDSSAGRGSNAEFDAMLREMSDERSTPGFVDPSDHRDGPLGFDPRSLAAAYANTPGGRGDG